MKTFYLYRESGRVILDKELPPKAALIRTIEGATWLAARAKISEFEFTPHWGYGWA